MRRKAFQLLLFLIIIVVIILALPVFSSPVLVSAVAVELMMMLPLYRSTMASMALFRLYCMHRSLCTGPFIDLHSFAFIIIFICFVLFRGECTNLWWCWAKIGKGGWHGLAITRLRQLGRWCMGNHRQSTSLESRNIFAQISFPRWWRWRLCRWKIFRSDFGT